MINSYSLTNLTLLLLVGSYLTISGSLQDDITSTYSLNSNTNQEIVKIGNTKYNHYNFKDGLYQPTQLTQLVFNVPKPKKLRKYRLPTEEEYAIKEQILGLYQAALEETGENSVYLNHLGRVLMALNPKYIATRRLKKIAFADPNNPKIYSRAPESELTERYRQDHITEEQSRKLEASARAAITPLKLAGEDEIVGKLGSVEEQFRKTVEWDSAFSDALQQVEDDQLNPIQLAFKRLIVCLNNPIKCSQKLVQKYPPLSDEPPVQKSRIKTRRRVSYRAEDEPKPQQRAPERKGYDPEETNERTGYGIVLPAGIPYFTHNKYVSGVQQQVSTQTATPRTKPESQE